MNWSEYKKSINSLTEEEKRKIESEAREIIKKNNNKNKWEEDENGKQVVWNWRFNWG